MKVKVCPRCGRTEKEIPFIGFFCRDCYLELHPPVKIPELSLKICPTCGRIFVGHWTNPDLTKIARWIQEHIKVSPDVSSPSLSITIGLEDKKHIEFRGILTGVVQNVPIQYKFHGTVRKVYEQCPLCARRAGGYYEAVLQLRGKRWREFYDRVISMVSSERDPKAFIVKELPRRNGIDLLIGSKKVAERIARKLKMEGAQLRTSYSQVGEKDGRPITREFLALRLD